MGVNSPRLQRGVRDRSFFLETEKRGCAISLDEIANGRCSHLNSIEEYAQMILAMIDSP